MELCILPILNYLLTELKIKYNDKIVGYIISHKNHLNRLENAPPPPLKGAYLETKGVKKLLHLTMFGTHRLSNKRTKISTTLSTNLPYGIFPTPGLCRLFACAKMLYRRLVDDVVEISVL